MSKDVTQKVVIFILLIILQQRETEDVTVWKPEL